MKYQGAENTMRVIHKSILFILFEIENEEVVASVLAENPAFRVRLILPHWPRRGLYKFPFGSLCIRTDPRFDRANGFFVCLFEKI